MADQFFERASDEDALRLVVAFYCIMEADRREEVMALAERYASEQATIDDLSPFVRQGTPRAKA